MGIHAIECNGDTTAFQWKILDQCGNQFKLMTLEGLYIRIMTPAINTSNEYRTRELALKAKLGDQTPIERKTQYETKILASQLNKTKVSLR